MFELSPQTQFVPLDRTRTPITTVDHLSSMESLYRYCDWLRSAGFSDTTIKSYRSWVRRFLTDATAHQNALGVTVDDVDMGKLIIEFKARLLTEEKYCPQSTNNFLTAMESFCRYLDIKLPEIKREDKTFTINPILTREEIQTVLRAISQREVFCRDKAMLLAFLHTGISLRHLRDLNINHLVADEQRQDLVLKFGSLGKQQIARIAGTSSLGTALLEWCSERPQFIDEQALFVSNAGQRLCVSSVDILIRKIGWKARVPLSIKLLRDSGKHFRSQGIDLDA